jgi:DNA-binding beta-propeller fold protein YncE
MIDPESARVVGTIATASTNAHRLIIAPDGERLYTENEEDATISVIDLPNRKLLGKIETPRPLAGIAISADGKTVIAVDDAQPTLFLIEAASGSVRDEVPLEGVPKPAQIARYAPDHSMVGVSSLNSNTVSLIDPSFREQTAISVGNQPMDMAFRGEELFVACQGDGSVHVIDLAQRRWKHSFRAGTGCESLAFF